MTFCLWLCMICSPENCPSSTLIHRPQRNLPVSELERVENWKTGGYCGGWRGVPAILEKGWGHLSSEGLGWGWGGGTGKSDPGPGAATSVTANKGDFLEFSVRGGQSTPPQGTIAPPEDSLHRAQVTRQLCHHETIATTWTTLRNHHRRRCPKMFAFVLLFYRATCPHCHILELSTFL